MTTTSAPMSSALTCLYLTSVKKYVSIGPLPWVDLATRLELKIVGD